MITRTEKRSIKQVLTIAYLIAVLLLALFMAMVTSRQIVFHLKNDAITGTYQLAERLAKDSRIALIQMANENIMPSVQMALDLPNIESVTLYQLHGSPLVGHTPKAIDFAEIAKTDFKDAKARLLRESADNIFIVSPVLIETMGKNLDTQGLGDKIGPGKKANSKELIGYVLISLSKTELYKTRILIWRENLIATMVITSFFFLALMQVLNRITTPIHKLAHFMSHPDTAKYYRKATVSGTKEMRDISTAFNALMNAFEHSNNKLLLSNEELESRVLERTHDLKNARDEARKYNIENRTLISSMNSALEEERKFIARELHDHLNSELIFVKLKLQRFKTICKKNHIDTDEISSTTIELIDRISMIYDCSRNIVRMLRPEVMDSLGLIGATQDRIDMFSSSQPDCRISLDYEGDFSVLNYHFSIAIFRIIQESLTNASKHAQATEIKIRLYMKCEAYPSGIYLCVSDNGIGFDTQARSDSGIGLISMRERAFALNGELKVESTPGKGSHVIASIPLDL